MESTKRKFEALTEQVELTAPQSDEKDAEDIGGQKKLVDIVLDGLIFVTKINHKNRCFIPSTHNYFAGVRVQKVLVDSGCSSILLPIEGSLDSLFSRFPSDEYLADIGGSIGVGGGSLVLLISPIISSSFPVTLCEDIVGYLNGQRLHIKILRFSLCSEDISSILSSQSLRDRFGSVGIQRLESFRGVNIPRRTHALLGQSVLKEHSCIKYSTVEFYVDPKVYTPISWNRVSVDTKRLLSQLDLPPQFEDWEDDDNLCHDEREDIDWEEGE